MVYLDLGEGRITEVFQKWNSGNKRFLTFIPFQHWQTILRSYRVQGKGCPIRSGLRAHEGDRSESVRLWNLNESHRTGYSRLVKFCDSVVSTSQLVLRRWREEPLVLLQVLGRSGSMGRCSSACSWVWNRGAVIGRFYLMTVENFSTPRTSGNVHKRDVLSRKEGVRVLRVGGSTWA